MIKKNKTIKNNKFMTKEEKKQLLERIEKRRKEVADENGNITFETFLRLTKEFFGQYSPNGGKTFDEYLARCTDADFTAPEPGSEPTNADDLPF
jgi:hypothetical protein